MWLRSPRSCLPDNKSWTYLSSICTTAQDLGSDTPVLVRPRVALAATDLAPPLRPLSAEALQPALQATPQLPSMPLCGWGLGSRLQMESTANVAPSCPRNPSSLEPETTRVPLWFSPPGPATCGTLALPNLTSVLHRLLVLSYIAAAHAVLQAVTNSPCSPDPHPEPSILTSPPQA